ncbi:hypothetical protein JBW_04707 [Pelosinus fermentans JBW45]|uniref:ATPase AAA-type core domain-containing protein n=2 Tax=Pelosinus TaxID=365348 RepID=I9NU07_9FIRM|nr:hypothetical protein JBW_04707 [Pelosinus fermentans JBW45]
MLLEVKIENFYSIKEQVVFSMLAGPDTTMNYNLYSPENYKSTRILKSAVFYGANAAGKTNVLRGLKFIERIILENNTRQDGDEINVIPFRMDEKYKDMPSKFDIIFIHQGIKYAYGFTIDRKKVHSEYLYNYPKGRQATLFERTDTNRFKFTKDKEEQEALSRRTLSNRLYLASATEWNYKPIAKAFEWFKRNLKINIFGSLRNWVNYTASVIHQNSDMKEAVRCLLAEADISIQDYLTEERDIRETDMYKVLPSTLQKTISSDLSDKKVISVRTSHRTQNENGQFHDEIFDLDDESAGTIKIFELAAPLLEVLENGHVLVIDELDIQLHPLLVENIVKKFHDPNQNTGNAQLIFTTHNTNLLTQTIFRRDQIWFVEKNQASGATDIYSLLDLKVRKDENIEKGYLAGRYGAVPFIGEEQICKWPK